MREWLERHPQKVPLSVALIRKRNVPAAHEFGEERTKVNAIINDGRLNRRIHPAEL